MAVKLRIPDAWEGRIHSEDVRNWLQGYFQRPNSPLPPDPGAGNARVSLTIPPRAVKVLEGLSDDPPSVALRRVIAANVLALPAPRYGMLIAALPGPPEPRLVSSRNDATLDMSEGLDADAQPDSAMTELEFWCWVAVTGLIVWVIWKYLGHDTNAALPTAKPVAEALRFVEWIPKGGV